MWDSMSYPQLLIWVSFGNAQAQFNIFSMITSRFEILGEDWCGDYQAKEVFRGGKGTQMAKYKG